MYWSGRWRGKNNREGINERQEGALHSKYHRRLQSRCRILASSAISSVLGNPQNCRTVSSCTAMASTLGELLDHI
ncbi:hypothetical protein BX666DRAFT_1999029 [Dichotomocladium elegans]|nr:hypothetical protein BX666DRAFT_1999029 [Dichotomocladium elegans]